MNYDPGFAMRRQRVNRCCMLLFHLSFILYSFYWLTTSQQDETKLSIVVVVHTLHIPLILTYLSLSSSAENVLWGISWSPHDTCIALDITRSQQYWNSLKRSEMSQRNQNIPKVKNIWSGDAKATFTSLLIIRFVKMNGKSFFLDKRLQNVNLRRQESGLRWPELLAGGPPGLR